MTSLSSEPEPDPARVAAEHSNPNSDSVARNPNVVFARKPPRKGPPKDSVENEQTRLRVVISFWTIVMMIGVPLWWRSTLVYRAPLPLGEMQSWGEGRACRVEFPLLVDVHAPLLPDPEHLLKTVQHALDDANDFSAHHLRLRLSSVNSTSPGSGAEGRKDGGEGRGEGEEEEIVAATLRLVPGLPGSTHSYSLSSSSRTIDLQYSPAYNPSSSASSTSLSTFVANTLQEIFAEEQQMISHLLSSASTSSSSSPISTSASPLTNGGESVVGRGSSSGGARKVDTTEVTRKMSRIVRYSPTYHLTFSLFTATGSPSTWEIRDAVEEYLRPLLRALDGISTFTVDSQVQFYASLSSGVVPTRSEDDSEPLNVTSEEAGTKWILRKEDLSSFINSAEWPLVSITPYPTLNFIIYVPPPSHTPLHILSSATNAFLLPQWGGVMILNPPSATTTHLSKQDLKHPLDIFATQLLSLLGAPTKPASLPLRIDSLTRQRAAELLISASSTLGSLYRLTLALPSISIPTCVLSSVDATLKSLRAACVELRNGRFEGALGEGRDAARSAEEAFFEKSMVGQVYFPEEHKVAVYLPLMGPVGVPLIMGAVKEVRRIWRRRRVGL